MIAASAALVMLMVGLDGVVMPCAREQVPRMAGISARMRRTPRSVSIARRG